MYQPDFRGERDPEIFLQKKRRALIFFFNLSLVSDSCHLPAKEGERSAAQIWGLQWECASPAGDDQNQFNHLVTAV